MELCDAYDRDLNRIEGMTLVRGEPVPSGVYHLVSQIVVRHRDGTYLMMQRDYSKIYKGGFWEVSAGGAALKGETALDCAKRELWEETGILAEMSDFAEIGVAANESRRYLFVVFLCETVVDKDSIRLQEGETRDYRWVTAEELESFDEEQLFSTRFMRFAWKRV